MSINAFVLTGSEPTLALFTGLGHWELLIVLAIGLLLFGKRLPDVGRSLGRSIVEFKRGVKGIQEEIDQEVDQERKDRKELGAAGEPQQATYESQDGRRVAQGERIQSPSPEGQ